MLRKKSVLAFFILCFSFSLAFAESAPRAKLSATESANLKQGADAYKNEDWASAIFFLRKVVSAPGNANDETMFMLIKSEIYAGEYRQAQNDCEKFLNQFALSPYSEYIQYQNGRLLHLLSRNEDAVLSLSDFCHQNPESELYPLALFWIAESFYDEYNFDSARGLYERVVTDYSACEKAPLAQYKLDLIERREREEKLLYLLKVIGEENLSTREEYERQLRVYALEDERGVRKELVDAEARIAELEALLESGGYPLSDEGIVTVTDTTEKPVIVTEEKPSPVINVTASTEPKTELKVDVKQGAAEQAQEPKIETASQEPSAGKTEAAGEANTEVAENSPAETTPQANASPSAPSRPKQATVDIIQNVSESSIRVKKDNNGMGTSASKAPTNGNSNADVQALKRKARQLQYLLEDQE